MYVAPAAASADFASKALPPIPEFDSAVFGRSEQIAPSALV